MKDETETIIKRDALNEALYRNNRCIINSDLDRQLRAKYADAIAKDPYVGFFKMREDENYSFDYRKQMNNEDILDCFYSSFARHLGEINSNDTNKLFVYCGDYAFIKDDMGSFRQIRVPYGDPRAEIRKYHDLEQQKPIYKSIDRCKDFESDKLVIILFTKLDFYYLQRVFATTMIQSTQADAKARVLKLVLEEKKD